MTKKIFFTFLLLTTGYLVSFGLDTWIRINQLGYLPEGTKKAIVLSQAPIKINYFSIHDVLTDKEVARVNNITNFGAYENFRYVYILNFSSFKLPGAYYIKADVFYSPTIFIGNNIYDNSADMVLNYFRQQRCGENMAFNCICHSNDGFDGVSEIIKPTAIETEKNVFFNTFSSNFTAQTTSIQQQQVIFNHIDATGGWHTGAGFTKNGALAATSILNLLMAYQLNPNDFDDQYDFLGRKIKNGVPDILDEIKWGLKWLIKLNPGEDTLYHQVGDDRDMIPGLEPDKDVLNYGYGVGKGRHVFRATGKPQGLFYYQNQSNGLASLAGKYSAAFALGSEIYNELDPQFSDSLQMLAERLYKTGKKYPGVTQSVPGKINRFTEEDNWNDDMEVAATQLYRLTFSGKYLNDAVTYGRMEPVSPWVFVDSVNYYQWFPFTNMGHIALSTVETPGVRNEFLNDIKTNLQNVKQFMDKSPFLVNIPMFRNSNNYVVSLATQCHLYRRYTADSTFIDLETALTDWLFGCNPWGISMMVGWPENASYPTHPCCYQYINRNTLPIGALVNGPVKISEYLKEMTESPSEENSVFNSSNYFYSNSPTDYMTNAPTFDGSASLLFLLTTIQDEFNHRYTKNRNIINNGCITRTDSTKKFIQLIFIADQYNDGVRTINRMLKKNNIQASFFVTSDFIKTNKKTVSQWRKEENYVGPYADKHFATNNYKRPVKAQITHNEFFNDLKNNYAELEKIGINRTDATLLYPASRIDNDSISGWCKEIGIKTISQTPGTKSAQDISLPEMRDEYYSSGEIYNQIISFEKNYGLNGHLLMFHTGASAKRTDKFYKKLSTLVSELKSKGYEFVTLKQTTDNQTHNQTKSIKNKKGRN